MLQLRRGLPLRAAGDGGKPTRRAVQPAADDQGATRGLFSQTQMRRSAAALRCVHVKGASHSGGEMCGACRCCGRGARRADRHHAGGGGRIPPLPSPRRPLLRRSQPLTLALVRAKGAGPGGEARPGCSRRVVGQLRRLAAGEACGPRGGAGGTLRRRGGGG